MACTRLPFGSAAAVPRAGPAQLGSASLSLAQRRRKNRRVRRRGWPRPLFLGSAWLSLAQPGSTGVANARSTSAGLRSSTRPGLAQLGSAWLSLAQRPPRGPIRRAGALGSSCGRLARLGSVWFSLAQLGLACARRFSAEIQTLRARVWPSLAQRPPHRAQGAQARWAVPAAAWFSLAQPGSAWLSRLGQRAQHVGRASALTRPGLAQLGSAWFSLV